MSRIDKKSKLALGTVQFGLPYGVANKSGQVSQEEVELILNEAKQSGINTLDTAIAYGSSETVLGKFPLQDFDVITKLPAVPANCKNVGAWVTDELEASLLRLNVDSIDGLLLHRPEQLSTHYGDVLYSVLVDLRRQGLIKKVGVSLYSADDLVLLSEDKPLDIVQVPFNILDSRLLNSGLLTKMEKLGTKLHVRSVFMQGLLLMSKSSRPQKFNRWSSLWLEWDDWLEKIGLSPLEACLRYVLSIPQIEKVIVGVDSNVQLQEILKAAIGTFSCPPQSMTCSDIKLLNPSLWNEL